MNVRRSLSPSNSSSIKSHNLRAILLTLLRHEGMSRVRIAQITELSTTTVTNLVAELLEQGIVAEEGSEDVELKRGVGRPRTALRLIPDARYVIGIYMGTSRVRVMLTDLFARSLAFREFTFLPETQPETVFEETLSNIQAVIAESGINRQLIIGVGIGAPGLVDSYLGVNILSPVLGWRNVPIRNWFASRLGLPVFVDNNVRAMAMAESLLGVGKDVYVLAYVYARGGVGSGLVVGGQLYRGGIAAGEIGHTAILPDSGEACRCGNIGCLETLVSESSIVRAAQSLTVRDPHGVLASHLMETGKRPIERIFDAARAGDPVTRNLLNERARYMGIGLANLVNTVSPEMIVLDGIFAAGQDLLFPPVRETLRRWAFAGMGEQVQLVPPTFGADAGVIGAAALALDVFFYEQSEVRF